MNCDRCNKKLDPNEKREHLGQALCEDCYMVVLSPVKTCDPWAVHSAKNLEKYVGNQKVLTPLQEKMLDILAKKGPLTPDSLLKACDESIDLEEIKREFASLRHMEKVRAAKQGPDIVWQLW
ncbi:MAG: hypothetical protein KKE62_12790 [Proteobacteria bacterium]|nr:hypothetical protein [Pseudomonadota bacterium]MBU1387675.1 hypothetical protein [Pseudomonadota bacterium]MBU1543707.1 hypothetical protein [Pseudomonadota bacterium]MBU2430341.1 hypothetical protein [Pseudomonadota bacterium]